MHTVININIHLPDVGDEATQLTISIDATGSSSDACSSFTTDGLASDDGTNEPPGPEAPDAPQISDLKIKTSETKPRQKAAKRGN